MFSACHWFAHLPIVCSDAPAHCGRRPAQPRCCTRRAGQTDTRSAPVASGRCTSPPSPGRQKPHWLLPPVPAAVRGLAPPSSPLMPGRGSPTWRSAGCTHIHIHTKNIKGKKKQIHGIHVRNKRGTMTRMCSQKHTRAHSNDDRDLKLKSTPQIQLKSKNKHLWHNGPLVALGWAGNLSWC